jgi:putative IMPACT (imprinted ancient) family translation regulator
MVALNCCQRDAAMRSADDRKLTYRCCYRQYGLLNENLLKNRNKNAKENFKRMGKVRLRFG